MLDQNATTMPSPEIAKEMSRKNDAVTISPQNDYGLGMYSKKISRCQTEELDDSDDSNSTPSTSSNKQTIQKNLQPLKIKIPKQSKPPQV